MIPSAHAAPFSILNKKQQADLPFSILKQDKPTLAEKPIKGVIKKEIERLEGELLEAEDVFFDPHASFSRTKLHNERKSNLKDAIETYKRALDEDDPNFFKEVARGVGDTLKDPGKLTPFLGTMNEAVDLFKTVGAAKKLQKGDELSPHEQSLVENYRAKGLEKDSMGYNVGAMVGQMPTFIAEFMLLGPVKTGVQASLKPVLRNVLGRKATTIVAGTIGAAAQGAVNVPMVSENTANLLLDNSDELKNPILGETEDQEDLAFGEALARGMGQTSVEYITEYMGRFITKPLRFMKKAFLSRFVKLKGPKNWNKLAKKAKFDGVIGEVFEEEVGEPIQSWLQKREYKAPFITPEGTERLVTEVLGIGAFGGLSKGIMAAVQRGEIDLERPQAQVSAETLAEPAKEASSPIQATEQPIVEGKEITPEEIIVEKAPFKILDQKEAEVEAQETKPSKEIVAEKVLRQEKLDAKESETFHDSVSP